MAVTKIWAVKDSLQRVLDYAANPDKTEYGGLAQALHYAADKGKTASQESVHLVTGIHCRADRAWADMRAVQERFGKTDKTVALHAYQSFRPGEVTPEQCHAIGVELARRVWGGRFQVLVATHLNTECPHNHFVINSVSYVDGKKYEQRHSQYAELRAASDALCREYRLSVIEHPGGKTPRPLYEAERHGKPTRYNQMRAALRLAMRQASTEQDFARILLAQGFRWQRSPRRKYATLQAVDGGRAVRLYRLGEEYDWPAIAKHLMANYQRYGPRLYDLHYDPRYSPKPQQPYATWGRCRYKGLFEEMQHRSSLWRLYMYYCYQLGIYPKAPKPRINWPEIRALWRNTEKMLAELNLVSRYNLHTTGEVKAHRARLAGQIAALTRERDTCTRALRRKAPPPGMAERRAALTRQLKALREEDKTAQRVIQRVQNTERCRQRLREVQEQQPARKHTRGRELER